MKYIATIEDRQFEIEINSDDEVMVDGQLVSTDFQSVADQPIFSLIIDGESYEASLQVTEFGVQVLVRGQLYEVDVEDERQRRLRESSGIETVQSGDYHLKAPMPGLIIAVPVEQGESIAKGDKLIILESMKMQNELKAPRDGTITGVRVKAGDNVDQNQTLLILS